MKIHLLPFLCWLLALNTAFAQQTATFNVNPDQPAGDVQPTMWGIFFEDINLGADGGLYAELVKNRSFEFSAPMMGWKEQKTGNTKGSLLIQNRGDMKAKNPRYLRVSTKNSNEGKYGISNEGFRGIGVHAGDTYHFSVLARTVATASVTMNIELQNPAGNVIGQSSVNINSADWTPFKTSFQVSATEAKARLVIWFSPAGTVDIDMVSLFPQKTWKNRPGGMRPDLVQLLADLKPGFLRFPGGCIVEGRELATRYQWKKTIGDIDQREVMVNRWNTEFAHRPTPDYFQSFGLVFFEYFLLSEDIGAEPLPILNCGMACQFNSGEVVPVDQLDPYIQDALDLVEFANGDQTTKWGRLRADLGHPAPFNLKFIGIGNEQWGEQYVERHKVFAKAVKDKYPNIKLVSSVGPGSQGETFDYLTKELTGLKADILDEHYYQNPEWFLQNAARYDKYARTGPKIFAGEYAAQSVAVVSPENKNNWRCAIAEAAFMTGLERNADVVTMASYAPLFAHAEGWQWTPNLIWFDNLRSYGTPNYYVQQLFSTNKGSKIIPVTYQNAPVTGQDGLYASSTLDAATNELIVKIVNTTASPKPAMIDLGSKWNKKTAATPVKLLTLKGDHSEAMNTLDSPKAISPVESAAEMRAGKVSLTLMANAVTVARIKL